MKKEIWMPILGYEEFYWASNLGRIRSLPRTIRDKKGRIYKLKDRIIKPHIDNRPGKDYYRVQLWRNHTFKEYQVSRLVWEAFNGPIPEGMQVNHINEDKTDNRLDNLNLMTPKENNNWGTRIQRAAETRRKKLRQYDLNGNFLKTFEGAVVFKNEMKKKGVKICTSAISRCLHGNGKTAYGYIWKYAS